jgi:hypothetical protein
MKKAILWLLFTVAAASAWEDDDYDNDDGICPLAVCHGIYVDTQYDIQHCGECDTKCFPNQICINGICTCPNNNNACGAACTACPTGQHCESFDDDYQCVCDNTVGSCGAPGSCSACTGATPDCINGACTCPNNNGACANGNLGPGSCSACTGPNQICDSTTGSCICPNTQTACGLNGTCTDCTLSGTLPNQVCSNGACKCPNTDSACSSVANCGACNTATGEVCVNGACGCCVGNTCTQCPTGSTGCTSGGATPGFCCITTGFGTCTADADCCSGTCHTATRLCNALGCAVINPANIVTNFEAGTLTSNPFTPASCLAACPPETVYYSLTFDRRITTPFGCFCYSPSYLFNPAAGDDLCPVTINGFNYGNSSLSPGFFYGPPNTEYVYVV